MLYHRIIDSQPSYRYEQREAHYAQLEENRGGKAVGVLVHPWLSLAGRSGGNINVQPSRSENVSRVPRLKNDAVSGSHPKEKQTTSRRHGFTKDPSAFP